MKKSCLVLVALFGVAVAELANITKCDESSDDICEVTEVNITPCKVDKSRCVLKKGRETTIQFGFKPTQHGFRAGRSTTTNFLAFWAYVTGAVDGGTQVDAAYFDFQKAFYAVDNDVLLKFNAASLTSGLWWPSPSGEDIPFDVFSNVDACQYTGCPTTSGQKQQLSYSLKLSKILPNGIYTFKWKLWDTADSTNMCCYKTVIALRK